jgi:hypothetical protein
MAECCCAECHLCRLSLMLSVASKPLMLRVTMLNVILLTVIMLSVEALISEHLSEWAANENSQRQNV